MHTTSETACERAPGRRAKASNARPSIAGVGEEGDRRKGLSKAVAVHFEARLRPVPDIT